ncbi:16S rRNA (uracil(1498)-N(3))-methyltransferase [Candidimonas nitroreducens]|uniref:Ribosomal RNA small subunit methyltransferase E n=1 Tax=Candidimonas nitroreducens TaxID=683354 RepID=A0A225MPI1_9BURK|nr:16S rRNA (uracil(1498)-N(3))-methyltransferase [Candidimonas nitroreducens]OWT61840.1 16S rRNA (uracil(1498)-N(3))-methyltransferase [Candidimonas nitroreducens]
MATPRFYCPAGLAAGQTIELPQALAHHALRVLRLRDGAAIALFDGRGGEYPATLHATGKGASALLGAHDAREAELAGEITLLQGIAAGDKMDWIIEKAVELGVRRLVPVAARRSVLQLSGARLEKRRQHWERVAQSASEQCGRNRLMQIAAPAGLADCLRGLDESGLALFCHPEAPQSLAQALRPGTRRLALLVGPEGGWAEDELELARGHGLQAVRHGARVLRTETAGLALVAAASALLGWD